MTRVEEYLDLPYHVTLVRDQAEDGEAGWVARVVELPGCVSQGETPDEAVANMKRAMEAWIDSALEDGAEVPRPLEENYNGRILLRVPASLHGQVLELARIEGVSLNQYLVAAIAGATGARGPERTTAAIPFVEGIRQAARATARAVSPAMKPVTPARAKPKRAKPKRPTRHPAARPAKAAARSSATARRSSPARRTTAARPTSRRTTAARPTSRRSSSRSSTGARRTTR